MDKVLSRPARNSDARCLRQRSMGDWAGGETSPERLEASRAGCCWHLESARRIPRAPATGPWITPLWSTAPPGLARYYSPHPSRHAQNEHPALMRLRASSDASKTLG